MKVIFACVHNAGRSQMAAAFFNQYAQGASALSAGTAPADKVHDGVLQSMREVGIDLGAVKPQLLTAELARGADMLITMGCGEACPHVPGLKRDDWPLPDPAGRSREEVASIRDEIKRRVQDLLVSLGCLADRGAKMRLQVFEPPMCCSTGLCGPAVDPRLVALSADLYWPKHQGVGVYRYPLYP